METVYFSGNECHTYGTVPAAGSKAPDFSLVDVDLKDITLKSFPGKKIVLNIFPSLDTPVCAMGVRKFHEEATKKEGAAVICVSMDLPFAAKRFCTLEGIENVYPASAFRSPEFARDYGVELIDGPLKGLLARAVIIIDENGKVIYRELVDEITHEPDYKAALAML